MPMLGSPQGEARAFEEPEGRLQLTARARIIVGEWVGTQFTVAGFGCSFR